MHPCCKWEILCGCASQSLHRYVYFVVVEAACANGSITPPGDEGRILSIANLTVHPSINRPLMASSLSARAVRTACIASNVAPRPLAMLIPRRTFTTSPKSESTSGQSSEQEVSIEEAKRVRWAHTPPLAKAPFSLRARKHPLYRVNDQSSVLDQFYVRMLGDGGDKVLHDELKWLAVTHKSFDQGRRGFNDRLAFLGMRELDGEIGSCA